MGRLVSVQMDYTGDALMNTFKEVEGSSGKCAVDCGIKTGTTKQGQRCGCEASWADFVTFQNNNFFTSLKDLHFYI